MSGVPGPVGRFAALFLTPLYLLLLASILNSVTHRDHRIEMTGMLCGAIALMIIIAILSVRLASTTDRESRFSISTLMLLTLAFSIYMAYISQFMNAAHEQEFSWYSLTLFLFYGSFFMIMTTMLLVRFTEALLAIALWIYRFFGRFAEN